MNNEKSQYWIHDWSPFLIEFPQNPMGIDGLRYYGLSYLVGIIFAAFFLFLCNKKDRIQIKLYEITDLITYIILGILVGGRIGYVFLYDLGEFIRNPIFIFRIDQGGMSSHGGIIGVILSILIFIKSRKSNISLLRLSDALTAIAPLGIALGRFANFINGELWGKVTNVSWAVLFPKSPQIYNPNTGFMEIEPRHPSQLYAMVSEGFIPLIYLQYRYWFSKYTTGQLFGEFLILYSVMRIINECFREPDANLIFALSRGQFYSIFFFILGILFIIKTKHNSSCDSY